MAEWPKAPVLKTGVAQATVGSNPTPSVEVTEPNETPESEGDREASDGRGARADGLFVKPIGLVRSPFRELAETPRQPRAAEGTRGRIELLPGLGFEDAIADLEGWDYVWVLFWFHRAWSQKAAAPSTAEEPRRDGWPTPFRAKVLPPRSERKRGVLSTRAPHRPNPIGLSVLRLLSVEGLVLHVEDLDLVDGTPVFDLKPYVPWTDAIPSARTGWLEPPEGHRPGGERPADPRPTWRVAIAPHAEAQLAWLAANDLGFDLRARVIDALTLGPQPHAYRRIKRDAQGLRIAVKEWYARFAVAGDAGGEHIEVTAIESGRRREEREGLHLAFMLAFPPARGA